MELLRVYSIKNHVRRVGFKKNVMHVPCLELVGRRTRDEPAWRDRPCRLGRRPTRQISISWSIRAARRYTRYVDIAIQGSVDDERRRERNCGHQLLSATCDPPCDCRRPQECKLCLPGQTEWGAMRHQPRTVLSRRAKHHLPDAYVYKASGGLPPWKHAGMWGERPERCAQLACIAQHLCLPPGHARRPCYSDPTRCL